MLGSEAFTQKISPLIAKQAQLKKIPRAQRFANRPGLEIALARGKLCNKARRDSAMRVTHLKHGYTLSEIGSHLGLHYTTVSKVINHAGTGK